MLGLLLAVSTFISQPAENGVQNIRIEFSGWPRVVSGVAAEDFVHETHRVDLGESFTFYAAGSFIGLDGGDVGEYDVRVGCENGPIFYERSLHRPVADTYDAEDWKYTAWPRCRVLLVDFIARVTGPNNLLRPGQEWSARPHFGVRLWTWPDLGRNEPDPGKPEDPPEEEKRATDYVPFADREEWAEKVGQAYSEWRGDRDLGVLLSRGEVVEALGFNAAQLEVDVNRLFEFRQERDTLAHRVANCSKHPDFADRCRVRKEVVNDFVRRAQTGAGAIYGYYTLRAAQCGVRWGEGFDSWQGFIQQPENPALRPPIEAWNAAHPNGCQL